MWNLDFEEKCINFVEQVYSDLQRVAFLFSSPWKSGDFSFDVRKITLEEEKITLEEVFSKTYVQKIRTLLFRISSNFGRWRVNQC